MISSRIKNPARTLARFSFDSGPATIRALLTLKYLISVISVLLAYTNANAATNTFFIDPAAAFTLTYDDTNLASSPISLASLGIFPGDVIVLKEVGLEYYEYPETATTKSMDGVFSSSAVVLGSSVLNRVPGAIQTVLTPIVTPNTYNGNYSTDIPEDFRIDPQVTVQVPSGAAYLFVEADSSYFGDNVSVSGTYGVAIYPAAVTIAVSASPANGGAVSGGGTFASGSSQTVIATANNGYTFTQWTENGRVVSSSASYTFTVTTNEALVANFTTNTATITVNASPTAGGTVAGGGSFAVGSQVQISASASHFDQASQEFFVFSDWSDGNTQNPRTVTVPSGGSTFTANFSQSAGIIFYHEPEALLGVRTGLLGVGHAFLQLSPPTGGSAYYGFYPINNIFSIWLGKVVDDSLTPWDFAIAFPLSISQYRQAAALVTQDLVTPPIYSLTSFNCMDWAAEVANKVEITLPPYRTSLSVASDPYIFGEYLSNLGAGAFYNGGLVIQNESLSNFELTPSNRARIPAPAPATTNAISYDYSYSAIESAGHTNPAVLASSMGFAYDFVNIGTVNANSVNGLSLNLAGPNTNQDLISMNWGDGTAFQEQSLTFSHFYSPGTYQADLLVIDAGAVHSYSITVLVSSSSSTPLNISVTPFSPASIPNQGFTSASAVPDFSVAQATSLSLSSNGQATISFLGIPTWTFTIEASSNLSQGFFQIGSASAGTNGLFQFVDPSATNSASRFYRASYP